MGYRSVAVTALEGYRNKWKSSAYYRFRVVDIRNYRAEYGDKDNAPVQAPLDAEYRQYHQRQKYSEYAMGWSEHAASLQSAEIQNPNDKIQTMCRFATYHYNSIFLTARFLGGKNLFKLKLKSTKIYCSLSVK
jgi:hypothetical protein